MSVNKKGQLIILSGPSGAGKGTILREVTKIIKNLKFSISVTTRKPRIGEIDGVNYYFRTIDEFKRMIDEGAFLEYAFVAGNYYGTPKKAVFDELEKGNNIILEIDVKGALQIKENFNAATMIFLLPPSREILYNRLKARGTETESELAARTELAMTEMLLIDKYEYLIINNTVEKAVEDLTSIIEGKKGISKFLVKNNKIILEKINGGNF